MKNKIKIDLPSRRERRYIVRSSKQFLKLLSPYVKRKRFSKNEYVYTIYFNDDEHVVPFEYSIKARKYLPGFIKLPVLDDDIYFLDLKMGKGEHHKEKIRLETTLEEATKIINEKYSFSEIPLRPYVLVQYLRHNYIPKNMGGVRISLDTNLKYFFFPKGQREGIEIGREDDYTRIEIKEQEQSNKDFVILIEKLLEKMNAFPIISKKFTAYDFLKNHRMKTCTQPLYKELKEFEIESKLEIEHEIDQEDIFYKIKTFFKDNNDFEWSSDHPYTHETASINRYYKKDGLFKALIKKDKARIITKSGGEIVEDQYNLNCIMKREEVKGDRISIWSELLTSATLLGELRRKRKAFWIVNKQTKRIYHISLDCCESDNKKLYQVEVEHTGRLIKQKTTKEKSVIDDIADITHILLNNFSLKPSQLTKVDWLGIK